MEQVESWATELNAVMERIGHRFVRSEARRRAKDYLTGLLSPAERKNSWQLAEAVGDETPYGLQQFLYRAEWDADEVRDDLRTYVVTNLSDDQAVLVVDETGFLKKGTHSVGVKRQYSGTAGRIENCQMGVFLAYASPKGHAFVDRELYLPEEWAQDRLRRQAAGVPEEVEFATKPELAQRILGRTFEAGVTVPWVTGDEVYGSHAPLRQWLEDRRQAYVLAVRRNEYVGRAAQGMVWSVSVTDVVAQVVPTAWERCSAGDGAKGPRLSDWTRVELDEPVAEGWGRWLLLRRSLTDPTDIAAYRVFAPIMTPLTEMVRVAGRRWTVEETIESAKGEVGLDQYEVRSWTGWYRHITLACLAHALLSVVRCKANDPATAEPKRGLPLPRQTNSLAMFKAQRGLSPR